MKHGQQPRFDRNGDPISMRTITQRCEQLLDTGTFRPIGRMAGKPEYDDDGNLARFTPGTFPYNP